MNIKLPSKLIILALSVFLFANNSNVLSQNLSFEELLNLQKEKKKKILIFFKEKNWMQDATSNNKWIYKKDIAKDNIDAIFTLQTENCDQNIINYIMSDSSTYNSLKDSFAKVSEQKNKIQSAGRYLEDYIYKDLYVRFFKTREINKIDFYSVWFFSVTDSKYLNKLKKFCSNLLNKNAKENPIETEAEFPGGEKERMKFITLNLEYPFSAKEKGLEGTVYIGFFVEKDGSLTNIKILKGLDAGFNEEVLRLVKLMPKWKPATVEGKPKRVMCNMPISFKLND